MSTKDNEIEVEFDNVDDDFDDIPGQEQPESIDSELKSMDADLQARLNSLESDLQRERAERQTIEGERSEAIRIANALYERMQAQGSAAVTTRLSALTAIEAATSAEIDRVKRDLVDATESGDGQKVADLTDKLSQLRMRQHEAANAKAGAEAEAAAAPAPEAQPQPQPRPQQSAQPPNPNLKTWLDANASWFQKDKVMTAAALGKNQELIEAGVDPNSKEFYDQITTEMHKRFSDKLKRGGSLPPTGGFKGGAAPGGRRIVKLSAQQRAIADELGVPYTEYARELIAMEKS